MSHSEDPTPPNTISVYEESTFQQEVQRLYQLTLYGRWLVVGLLWASLGLISLWSLRSEIALWFDYFTWTAVRYSLAYNRLPAIGLSLCIGATLAVLLWQSRNMLWGIPPYQVKQLENQVWKIRQQGSSHPLWKWVCQR